MMNQGTEGKTESVDIKEYLAVLLKRKWLVLVCFLLSMAGTTAFLFTRQSIYRASAKLLVTKAGTALPMTDVKSEDEGFYATQIDIMMSPTMLKRVQQRMKKTADDIRENLADLKVTPARAGATIIMITVDSPSTDFAKDFANALSEEYLRFRDEQRAQSSESALLMLTREINRLGQELKGANEKLLSWAKEHQVTDLEGRGFTWYNRYQVHLAALASAGRELAAVRARKEFLDSRPDALAVLALLASQKQAPSLGASAEETEAVSPGLVIKEGSVVDIAVVEDPSLNSRIKVANGGVIEYPPLGMLAVEGMTPQQLELRLREGLKKADAAGAIRPTDQSGKRDSQEVAQFGIGEPTVRVVVEATPNGEASSGIGSMLVEKAAPTAGAVGLDQATLGVLTDTEAKRLFELERKRRTLQVKLEEMRKFYKPKHPALGEMEQQLQDATAELDSGIAFLRQKAEADLLMAQKKYDDVLAVSKQMDAAAIAETGKMLELKGLREDADRVRSLYNALLSQLMKIDVSQGFNARTVSVLEAASVDPEPIYPKKVKGLLVAAFFGLALGLALAFFIEYIDDSLKLAEEVERDLQLPFLGMVPAAQWNPDDLSAHRLDKLKQQGGVAEAYRVVRSAIIFSIPREKLRSILLASAVPREGKTTSCINLSIGFAQIEERVLLVDADLRRGEIHKYFGFEKEKGLADVLLGEATPEEVIKHTDVPKLDVITVGSYPANPAELLLGWRLKELLDWAYQHYDRVIIDCTPVMGIADSAILGSAVDGVLFVIWAGRTSRRYVRVAKMTAVSRGAKIFGFVLNNLEPGRVGYYHYYPYYYSYYSRGYYYAHKEEDQAKGGDIKGIEVPTTKEGKDEIDDVY